MINIIKSSIGNIIGWNSLHKTIDISTTIEKLNYMSEKDIINLANEIVANKIEFLNKANYSTFLQAEFDNLENLLILEKKMIRRVRKNRSSDEDNIISVDSLLTC